MIMAPNPAAPLHCPSCGRTSEPGTNYTEALHDHDSAWCSYCAHIIQHDNGKRYVVPSGPGRMFEGTTLDVLAPWRDCFVMTPKRRILTKNAKSEIQRAWRNRDGDKRHHEAMFCFYCWLTRHRPYFLTFRCNSDRWQTIHCWLREAERQEQAHANHALE